MKAYSLAQEFCPNKLTYQTSSMIGDGADGAVYSILNSPNVIKYSVIYDINFNYDLDFKYKDLSSKLSYIHINELNLFVKIFDFNFLYEGYRKTISDPQQFLLHYYVMEKLNKISDDEKKVVHTIFSHEDMNKKKQYSPKKLKNLIEGLSRGLDFDKERVMLLKEKIDESPLIHTDIHVRNVMKDDLGNFKLIDLDRLQWRIK